MLRRALLRARQGPFEAPTVEGAAEGFAPPACSAERAVTVSPIGDTDEARPSKR